MNISHPFASLEKREPLYLRCVREEVFPATNLSFWILWVGFTCKYSCGRGGKSLTHTQYYAGLEHHTKLAAKMTFDEIFELTAGVYFSIIRILIGYLSESP